MSDPGGLSAEKLVRKGRVDIADRDAWGRGWDAARDSTVQEHTEGAQEALNVLVCMTSENELCALEATFDDYGRDDAIGALQRARKAAAVLPQGDADAV